MTLATGNNNSRRCAFTLIELILVLALLVIITSIAVPAMARFIRGRALGSEARQLMALMHMAQSRAVSEGMPMMLWVDQKNDQYGVAAETTSGPNGDPEAENLQVDSTLQISVVNVVPGAAGGSGAAISPTTFHNLPAIRFLPDGTVDENSPQALTLVDTDGRSVSVVEKQSHSGYEISDIGS